MKTAQKLKIIGFLMTIPFASNALDCPSSGRLLTVSGATATNSVSNEIQSGVMHLQLSDASGVVYQKDCGLIGKVVRNTSTGSLLDHTVICGPADKFNTSEDLAPVTGTDATPTTPATYYDIVEVISNIEQGEGLFKNMRADITATGRVNLTPPFNNDFTLAGEVCLKR